MGIGQSIAIAVAGTSDYVSGMCMKQHAMVSLTVTLAHPGKNTNFSQNIIRKGKSMWVQPSGSR